MNIITILSLVIGLLICSGVAFAHGTETHSKTVPANAQMNKLHAMMPMFSAASAKMEIALEKGEVPAIETEARKIMAALPDLKKSKPHKNIKQQKRFVALATSLEKAVTSTVDLAIKGDLVGAKTAFKNAEAACAACHAKFRD